MLLGTIAGLLLFAALIAYGVLPWALARGDWRLIRQEWRPIEPGTLDPAHRALLEKAQADFGAAGLELDGIAAAIQDRSANGEIRRTVFVFRDPEGAVLGWQSAMQGVRGNGQAMSPLAQQSLVFTALPDGYLISTAGFGPDIPPTSKVVALWERGASLERTVTQHRAWLARRGAAASPTPKGLAVEAMVALATMQIAQGLAEGTHIADAQQHKFRLSFLHCAAIVWWSLPPGRWFWRNPRP